MITPDDPSKRSSDEVSTPASDDVSARKPAKSSSSSAALVARWASLRERLPARAVLIAAGLVVVLAAIVLVLHRREDRDDSDSPIVLRNACDDGKPKACRRLAVMFDTGVGVVKDASEAAKLYQRACDAADVEGCGGLGVLLYDGRGVTPSVSRSIPMLERGCAADIVEACSRLGSAYAEGNGVVRDLTRGSRMLGLACERGSARACGALGTLTSVGVPPIPRNEARAKVLFQRGCTGGDAKSCLDLGRIQVSEPNAPVDQKPAIATLARACELGSAFGCRSVAQLVSRDVVGVARDPNRAAFYASRACDLGDAMSCEKVRIPPMPSASAPLAPDMDAPPNAASSSSPPAP